MTLQKILLLSFIGSIILFACNTNTVYESYNPIGGNGWNKDSVFNYTFNIKDSAQHYNVYFNLRNTVDYSFNNIWLFVSVNPPEGKTLTDTVEFVLADPSGRWFGHGHGKFRDNKLLYRRNVFFPQPGKYSFNIQQGMRESLLKGINDFGISVEKTN